MADGGCVASSRTVGDSGAHSVLRSVQQYILIQLVWRRFVYIHHYFCESDKSYFQFQYYYPPAVTLPPPPPLMVTFVCALHADEDKTK